MRLIRIYVLPPLTVNHTVFLDKQGSNHVLNVLRLKIADPLIIFDGLGNEFDAEIISHEKQLAHILIKRTLSPLPESSLKIHLGQAISRGEKMDYTLQKAVELGVNRITPLFTEYAGVNFGGKSDHKLDRWRKIVISACEQSGRSYLPHIVPPQHLHAWLQARQENCKLLLDPGHEKRLKTLSPPQGSVCLLVGPEGGFSDHEVALSQQLGFEAVSLGPRILRTETAAPAAIAALQCLWGDM